MSDTTPTREQLREMIIARSFVGPKHCPACGGSGTVEDSDGPRIVHTYRGPFGADNDLDQVLEQFDKADVVLEVRTMLGQMIVIAGPGGSVAVDL